MIFNAVEELSKILEMLPRLKMGEQFECVSLSGQVS